jgi:hypothetical protein
VRDHTFDLWKKSESPIESLLIGGLEAARDRGRAVITFGIGDNLAEQLRGIPAEVGDRGLHLYIFPQAKLGHYRADFLVISAGNGARIGADPVTSYRAMVMECDGRAFHTDKAKDDRRDLWFWDELGFHTFRLTGSESFRDPAVAADRLVDKAMRQMWQTEVDLEFYAVPAGAVLPEQGFIPFSQALQQALSPILWAYLGAGARP